MKKIKLLSILAEKKLKERFIRIKEKDPNGGRRVTIKNKQS